MFHEVCDWFLKCKAKYCELSCGQNIDTLCYLLYLKVTGVELDCGFEGKKYGRIGMVKSWELQSVYIG